MTAILPLAVWASGTNENSLPANDNALRVEALSREIISKATTAQPGSPSDGDAYIIPASATGAQWATFTEDDIAIYRGGTWYAWQPVEGLVVNVAGTLEKYEGGAWSAISGGGGDSPVGRHMVPIMAAAMAPSASGGCAALATAASAANQPDIVSLDFDPSTQEYAQFAIPMPESWDEGTVTFMPIWSHAATVTNFGVVWELQAVAVSNDDAIAVAYGTAQSSTDTGGTTNDIYIGPESAAITVGGTPAAGDVVYFRISRVTGSGSDTMAVDARLHGIRLYITTAAATD